MIALVDVRPLAAGAVRVDGDATVIAAPRRDVRIEGAQRLATRLLGACDGRRTIRHLLDALDPSERDDGERLLSELLKAGALVDCTEAYRVFHWQSSVDSGFYRMPDAATLRSLTRETYSPRTVGEPAHPLAPAATTTAATLRRRASSTLESPPRPVSFAELSAVLEAMYGAPAGAHRPVPSGGGAYPLALHACVRGALDPLTPGLWWYDPAAASLRLVREGRRDVDRVILPEATANRLVAACEPIVFVSADLERPARKYANRAYRWALIEAGAVTQNAYVVGAELGIPIRVIGGIDDRAAHDFLDLDDEVQPLLAVLLGS